MRHRPALSSSNPYKISYNHIIITYLFRRQQMDKKAKLVGINHVALSVGDVDEALKFYGSIFDFEIKSNDGKKAFLNIGDQFLALFSFDYQPHEDMVRHFGLVVDDRTTVTVLTANMRCISSTIRYEATAYSLR